MRINDGFTAYCFDEACCFIISQTEEGKRPFFRQDDTRGGDGGAPASSNSLTVEMMKKLGAEVKKI